MIWTTDTHGFAVTTCNHLGAPCPALHRMLVALSQALTAAEHVTEAGFEISGDSTLDGCPKRCPARFFASADQIRVFCGTTGTTDRAQLDRFADAIFSDQTTPLPALHKTARPCAIGTATPLHRGQDRIQDRSGADQPHL